MPVTMSSTPASTATTPAASTATTTTAAASTDLGMTKAVERKRDGARSGVNPCHVLVL
jgi:hypothetical protein